MGGTWTRVRRLYVRCSAPEWAGLLVNIEHRLRWWLPTKEQGKGQEEKQEVEKPDYATLLDEAKMSEPRKMADGTLDPEYSIDLVNFISRTAKKLRSSEVEKALARRRELLKADKMEEYSKVVIEENEAYTDKTEAICLEVLAYLGLTEEQFDKSMAKV